MNAYDAQLIDKYYGQSTSEFLKKSESISNEIDRMMAEIHKELEKPLYPEELFELNKIREEVSRLTKELADGFGQLRMEMSET